MFSSQRCFDRRHWTGAHDRPDVRGGPGRLGIGRSRV